MIRAVKKREPGYRPGGGDRPYASCVWWCGPRTIRERSPSTATIWACRSRSTYEGEGGAEVTILGAGRATLELSNPAQVDLIDRVEVGRTGVAPALRVCFEVDDAAEGTARLAAAGAAVLAQPTETPWRSLNSRLNAPAGLQLTIFEELDRR